MDWETVFKTIGAAIISAGGAGAIIVCCVKFSANYLSERMMKKYEANLNKEIERYKHELELETEKYKRKSENLTFVTKKQFETEFTAYQEIFSCLFEFSRWTMSLFPFFDQLPVDRDSQKQVCSERFISYQNAFNRFSEILEKNAPFIPSDNYTLFDSLRARAHALGCVFPDLRLKDNADSYENYEVEEKVYKDAAAFSQEVERAKNIIRNYLSTLKVDKE